MRGNMAYLRREKEIVEIDFPLETVWTAISKTLTALEWITEETDQTKHQTKTKTKPAFMSYRSTLTINATNVNENTTRVNITAETPTTTITGIIDFGRTRERIETFLETLMKQLTTNPQKT
jgi:hypothetical protein